MAEVEPLPELCCLKNSEILVHVEEALFDFLVVSYEYDSRLYQGVLLDASKRPLPCGILAPPGFPETDNVHHGLGTDEDKLHSVAQRYSYFQGKSPPHMSSSVKDNLSAGSAYHMRRAMRGGQPKFRNSRMTVRLRPRQVLCSKCKSICNENSENVDLSRKRKGVESNSRTNSPVEKRNCPSTQISPKSPRPPFSENPQENKTSNTTAISTRKNSSSPPVNTSSLHTSLIPKTIKETESLNSLHSNVNKLKLVRGYLSRQPSDGEEEAESSKRKRTSKTFTESETNPAPGLVSGLSVSSPNFSENEEIYSLRESPNTDDVLENDKDSSKLNSSFASTETDESQDRMVLRKKRNVGSMEDLWDESVFLEDATRRTTPVIKISFGTQGEGTVLKIPAKVRSYHNSESDADDQEERESLTFTKEASVKAAKKALKKAKKEARKKTPEGESSSSPALPSNSPPALETSLYHRRRKRKVKHKKKHKEVDEQDQMNVEAEEEDDNDDGGYVDMDVDVPPLLDEDPLKVDNNPSNKVLTADSCDYDLMREKCLKQKLSISLKRLNASVYARCGDSSSAGSYSPGSNSELSGADEVPDFPGPPPDHALTAVDSCLTNDGRTMEVGDVVWGKIHGFPWWPGKVLSITIKKKEDDATRGPQVHVAWYGSSTSSLMPCDQLSPFLETFKTRYNKKKRGSYKEAIRQATCEARKNLPDPLHVVDVLS